MTFWKTPRYRDAFRYARNSTALHSRSFYASACMLPQERRWATFAVYAFCRHVDNLVDLPRNRSAAEVHAEMDALRRELLLAYRTGESEHPILRAFIVVAKKYHIPHEYPLDLMAGVEMDLQQRSYKTFEDLYLFSYRVAGVVGLMMTCVLGYRDKAAFHYAEKLGIALQLTNILRDIQEDKEMGRIYLPGAELYDFGITPADVVAERWSPEMEQLMRFQIGRARAYYEEAEPGIALLEPSSRFAIHAAARIYGGLLDKIEARGFNPFKGRVVVSQTEKVGILLSEFVGTRLMSSNHKASLPNPKVGITRGILGQLEPLPGTCWATTGHET